MLTLRDVDFQHHPAAAPVLRGISLDFSADQSTAIVGANGSGKSTLGRLLAGLVPPTAGELVCAPDLARGLVMQDPAAQLLADTVERDVAFGPESQCLVHAEMDQVVTRELERLDLAGWRFVDPRQLSGGEQQRVAVAGVLACEPRLLVFDEAASQLDGVHRGRLLRLARELAQAGACVVWITQELQEITQLDRVIALSGGQVAYDGSAAGFLAEPELVELLQLELPASVRFAKALARAGVDVPLTASVEQLVVSVRGRAVR